MGASGPSQLAPSRRSPKASRGVEPTGGLEVSHTFPDVAGLYKDSRSRSTPSGLARLTAAGGRARIGTGDPIDLTSGWGYDSMGPDGTRSASQRCARKLTVEARAEVDRVFAEEGVPTHVDSPQAI